MIKILIIIYNNIKKIMKAFTYFALIAACQAIKLDNNQKTMIE